MPTLAPSTAKSTPPWWSGAGFCALGADTLVSAGLQPSLERMAQLGASAIWLQMAPKGEAAGDLQAVIAPAHALGLKVIVELALLTPHTACPDALRGALQQAVHWRVDAVSLQTCTNQTTRALAPALHARMGAPSGFALLGAPGDARSAVDTEGNKNRLRWLTTVDVPTTRPGDLQAPVRWHPPCTPGWAHPPALPCWAHRETRAAPWTRRATKTDCAGSRQWTYRPPDRATCKPPCAGTRLARPDGRTLRLCPAGRTGRRAQRRGHGGQQKPTALAHDSGRTDHQTGRPASPRALAPALHARMGAPSGFALLGAPGDARSAVDTEGNKNRLRWLTTVDVPTTRPGDLQAPVLHSQIRQALRTAGPAAIVWNAAPPSPGSRPCPSSPDSAMPLQSRYIAPALFSCLKGAFRMDIPTEDTHCSAKDQFRRFLQWQSEIAAFQHGNLKLLPSHKHLLAFTRTQGNTNVLCVFNLSDRYVRHGLPATCQDASILAGSGFQGGRIVDKHLDLDPW